MASLNPPPLAGGRERGAPTGAEDGTRKRFQTGVRRGSCRRTAARGAHCLPREFFLRGPSALWRAGVFEGHPVRRHPRIGFKPLCAAVRAPGGAIRGQDPLRVVLNPRRGFPG
jgi:hypothetical protein